MASSKYCANRSARSYGRVFSQVGVVLTRAEGEKTSQNLTIKPLTESLSKARQGVYCMTVQSNIDLWSDGYVKSARFLKLNLRAFANIPLGSPDSPRLITSRRIVIRLRDTGLYFELRESSPR
ncbi:hypothetical protein Sjap_018254 [Stephania japonica]|uniref:Uncharacterized protein n=1 Tax=Stephania japonica TaxID=461633 RepID=A0AAP0I7N7_9MAGN